MNKTLIIIISGVALLVVAVLAIWYFGAPAKVSTSSTGTNTVTLPVATSTENPVLVTGTRGSSIATKNFIADPTTAPDPINSGYYYLGYHVNEGTGDATATANPPYIIEYIAATQYFNIALLQEPIGPIRMQAEQFLMYHLGISQAQMCQLNYTVSVPDRVNTTYSGTDLRFSFCPGATVLPN